MKKNPGQSASFCSASAASMSRQHRGGSFARDQGSNLSASHRMGAEEMFEANLAYCKTSRPGTWSAQGKASTWDRRGQVGRRLRNRARSWRTRKQKSSTEIEETKCPTRRMALQSHGRGTPRLLMGAAIPDSYRWQGLYWLRSLFQSLLARGHAFFTASMTRVKSSGLATAVTMISMVSSIAWSWLSTCRPLHWLRSLQPRLPKDLPRGRPDRSMSCMIDETNQENGIALHHLLSARRAGPVRQRCDGLLRIEFIASSSDHDAGLFATSSAGLFRKCALSDLAIQLRGQSPARG